MFLLVLLAAVVLAVITGGDLRRLTSLDIRRFYWMLGSFAVRTLADNVSFSESAAPVVLSASVVIVSYGALVYGLAANLDIPGIRLILLGTAGNFLVIAANSFRMPVRIDFLETTVRLKEAARLAGSLTHATLDSSTRLAFLADILSWNILPGGPSVFSVGDILIAAGAGWLIIRASKPRFCR